MSEFSADSLSDAISAVFGSTDNASALQISDSAGVIRVTLGALGNGDYGLKVISTDGSTVIIDGTSDMFRIAATGTLTANAAANTGQTATVVLSGLTFATTPALISQIAGSASATDDANPIYFLSPVPLWGSATSGGATNRQTTGVSAFGMMYDHLTGTSPTPTLYVMNNGNAAGLQLWGRYYVLQQVAL